MSLSRHLSRFAVAAVALAMLSPFAVARAQDPFDAKAAGHVRDRYLADMDTLHKKVLALANAIPEDKYSWRPSKDVRSVSEVFMHIALANFYLLSVTGPPMPIRDQVDPNGEDRHGKTGGDRLAEAITQRRQDCSRSGHGQ